MKKRLLLIIIALLALVSGAQAETGYPPVKIYDGYKPKSLFNQYLAMFQVVANVEGKLVLETTSSNVLTFKYNQQNEMFVHFQTKRPFSKNEAASLAPNCSQQNIN